MIDGLVQAECWQLLSRLRIVAKLASAILAELEAGDLEANERAYYVGEFARLQSEMDQLGRRLKALSQPQPEAPLTPQ